MPQARDGEDDASDDARGREPEVGFNGCREDARRLLRNRETATFEAAFASKFAVQPLAMRTYEPQKPKVPWYLDPESGGPNPAVKKPGVRYDADSQGGTEGKVESP